MDLTYQVPNLLLWVRNQIIMLSLDYMDLKGYIRKELEAVDPDLGSMQGKIIWLSLKEYIFARPDQQDRA